MGALSKVLRDAEGGALMFHCPGCKCSHGIHVGDGPGPRWTWNGNAEKPTFSPSILTRWTKYLVSNDEADALAARGEPIPHADIVCHSFVTDGRIQFLSDCTHELAGQTVDLPDND